MVHPVFTDKALTTRRGNPGLLVSAMFKLKREYKENNITFCWIRRRNKIMTIETIISIKYLNST
jgi:hypothetical protein